MRNILHSQFFAKMSRFMRFSQVKLENLGILLVYKIWQIPPLGWESMSIIILGKLRFPTNSQTTSDRIWDVVVLCVVMDGVDDVNESDFGVY